jgi:hypothetical protein
MEKEEETVCARSVKIRCWELADGGELPSDITFCQELLHSLQAREEFFIVYCETSISQSFQKGTCGLFGSIRTAVHISVSSPGRVNNSPESKRDTMISQLLNSPSGTRDRLCTDMECP